jgi:RimJ/RimL family protein N-acetyltransferase
MAHEVRLREMSEGDMPVLFEHQRDPESNRMAAFPPRTRDAFDAHFKKVRADPQNIMLTVLYEEQVAGSIMSWVHADERLVGYWIGREFWGRGIATRALTELLRLVKERPLYALVATHNGGSVRVLQKNGFVILGEEEGLPAADGTAIREYRMKLE